MKIKYDDSYKFSARQLQLIELGNEILENFRDRGYSLTLRQLHYQIVSLGDTGIYQNNVQNYKYLGKAFSEGRKAGLVDWEHIEDRSRHLHERSRFEKPKEVLDAAVESWHIDMWDNQKYRPEVWVEKDALIEIVGGICYPMDVPYMACRGHSSQSEEWRAAMRMRHHLHVGQIPIVLYFGDHDPSGVHMTEDHAKRLSLFAGEEIPVIRCALTIEQIRSRRLPPNPVKLNDSRAQGYMDQFGEDCWELDALDPEDIEQMIQAGIDALRDETAWEERKLLRERKRGELHTFVSRFREAP